MNPPAVQVPGQPSVNFQPSPAPPSLVINGFTIQSNSAVRIVQAGGKSFTLTVPLNGIADKASLENHLAYFNDDFCRKGAEMCLKMQLGVQREGKQTIKSISVQVNDQGKVRTITKDYEKKGDLESRQKEVNLTDYKNNYEPTLNQQPPADNKKTKEKIAKWEATLEFMNTPVRRAEALPAKPQVQAEGDAPNVAIGAKPAEAAKPAAAKPAEVAKPAEAAAKPAEVAKPAAAKPAEAEVAKPAAAKPAEAEVAKPAAAKPAAAKPAAAKPAEAEAKKSVIQERPHEKPLRRS